MRLEYDEIARAHESSLRRLVVFAGLMDAETAATLSADDLRSVLVAGGIAKEDHPAVRFMRELGYM